MAKIRINNIPEKMRNKSVSNHNYWFTKSGAIKTTDTNYISPVKEEITTSVKEVPEEIATIEAEKGELITKPGLVGIYKILGKTHANGGTKLNPEPGSFIFSNDPRLSINKTEKKLFDFKEGGSVAKRKNTPAKILEREIDMEEYNRYLNILQNPKAEKIERATAQIMIDKYQKIIGQVAYLQESKKNKPVPEFAMGTAPIKNPELTDKEQEQEMYKQGGLVKLALGDEWCPCGKDENGKCLPCEDDVYKKVLKEKAKKVSVVPAGYDYLYKDEDGSSLYGKFGTTPGNKKKMTNQQWLDYLKNETPQQKIKRLQRQSTEGKDTEDYVYTNNQRMIPNVPLYTAQRSPSPPATIVTKENPIKPTQPAVGEEPTPGNLPYDIKGYLTPAQKAHLSYLGLQAMGIKRYMPMREQIHLGRVSLDKQNLQPFLNGIRNQEFQAYNSANVVNPRQAALLNSNTFGKGIDAETQARGQVEAANIQIGNQENLTNLQQSNQEQMFNIPASGKYYDQTVISAQNFDDERRFANNQVMSTLNKYQSDADALAWSLASVNKYGTRKVTDPKTGKIYNQPVPLYEYLPSGRIRYNSDVASLNMATGADKTNSIAEIKSIMEQFGLNSSDPKQIYAFAKLYESITGKGKNAIYQNNPTFPQ